MKHYKIYKNLSIFFALLLLATSLYLLLIFKDVRAIENFENYAQAINSTFDRLINIEFGFLFQKKHLYLSQLNQSYATLKGSYKEASDRLKEEISKHPQKKDLYNSLYRLKNHLDLYYQTLHKLIVNYQTMGLDYDHGLYGSLRKSAHILENSFSRVHAQQHLILLLQMRRHEKDFMLRGEQRYVQRFLDKAQRLEKLFRTFSTSQQKRLFKHLLHYKKRFLSFVEAYQKIGLDQKSGILSKTAQIRAFYKHNKNEIDQKIQLIKHPLLLHRNIIFALLLSFFILAFFLFLAFRKEFEFAKERNPLTDLNGNKRINKHLEELKTKNKNRIIVYFDFDFFKPFNDHFGFKIGDEAINTFADLLRIEFGHKKYFIGHIGGDDFIVAATDVSFENVLKRIKHIQKNFHKVMKKHYTPDELKRGCSIQKDRFGEQRALPLLSVSAAVIKIPKAYKIQSIDEISDHFAQIKEVSKRYGIAAISLLS